MKFQPLNVRIMQKIVEQIAIKIWERIRSYNFEFRKKVPELRDYYWPEWKHLSPLFVDEKIHFLIFLFEGDVEVSESSVVRKHNLSVCLKINDGWQLEKVRSDALKHDPYLKSLTDCPDWMFEWCRQRDLIEQKTVREMLF